MKTLFVHYSLEGNCRALSEAMAGAAGGTLAELVPVKDDMPRKGFMKYFIGGKRALLKDTEELKPLGVDVAGCDLIIVGGPVWFGRMTPPVRSFLEAVDWQGKKAAVFAMHRGGKGKAVATMAEIIKRKGGVVTASAHFADLRRGKAETTLEEAVAWAETVVEEAKAEIV